MSESLVIHGSALPATAPHILSKIVEAEQKIGQAEQISVQTEHILHGGMYSRTVRLAPSVIIVGALLKVPSMLVVQGTCHMLAGEKWYELSGYTVMPASAGRKQVFITETETSLTMIFPTNARTVEQAESEFTDEGEKLMSRRSEHDLINITGE